MEIMITGFAYFGSLVMFLSLRLFPRSRFPRLRNFVSLFRSFLVHACLTITKRVAHEHSKSNFLSFLLSITTYTDILDKN